MLILIVTLYPFSFQNLDRIHDLPAHLGVGGTGLLRPIIAIKGSGDLTLGDLEPFANFLLFIPLASGLAVFLKRICSLKWIYTFFIVQVICTGFSTMIEILQIFEPSRHSSIPDIISNSVGALAGYLACWLWSGREKRRALLSPKTWILTFAAYMTIFLSISLYAAYAPHLWSLRNWDPTFKLAIGNELSGDRPWQGTLSNLLITDQALPGTHITAILSGNWPETSYWNLPLAFYPLNGAAGSHPDQRGNLPTLSWRPVPPKQVYEGSVKVDETHWLETNVPVPLATDKIRNSSQLTVGTTFSTADLRQYGPARIITLSKDPNQRNITIGQDGNDLVIRLRTPIAGENGTNVTFIHSNLFLDFDTYRVAVVYSPSAIKLYVGDRAYITEFTPKARVYLFFVLIATGRIDVEVGMPAPIHFEELVYRYLLLFPTGIHVVLIALTLGAHLSRSKGLGKFR